jgi:hypothetical protein
VIVVRHAVVVDEPVERAGHLWTGFVRHEIGRDDFAADEWLEADGHHGVMTGDVHFETVGVARCRVTLTVRMDLPPSDPRTGHEVEAAYRRAVDHLDRFHDFVAAEVAR